MSSKGFAVGLLSVATAVVLLASPVAAAPAPSPSPTPIAANSCSAKSALTSKDLGQLYGYVIDVASGKVLINVRGTEATPSASVLKVVTAAAAMVTLPTDYRAQTKVFTLPGQPGTIVLQGGGDHTLSRMTGESFTTYSKPARLEALASQVLLGWNSETPITKIILDAGFFAGPSYNSAWKLSDRTNGYISHITALQVDSDRANPDLTSKAYSGYRSTNPVLATGKFFKESLEGLADTATLVEGKTPTDAVLLTGVNSQPITNWLSHAISVSDNTETEFIARHAAKFAGLEPSFKSIEPLAKRALATLGVDSTGLKMYDGSGLAQGNRVTAKMIAQLMTKVANGNLEGNPTLAQMESYLPVAGKTGTLAGRFNGANVVARNFVLGKSGYIPGLYSLAGIVNAKDGTRLAYAFFARSAGGKTVGYAARPALDTLATRLYQCGFGLKAN